MLVPDIRTMAIRVLPTYRESFDSLIARLAHKLGVSRTALLNHFGLSPTQMTRSKTYGVGIPSSDAEQLATILGLSTQTIHDTTMKSQDYRSLRLSRDGRKITTTRLWGQTLTTRVCPDCLDEAGGSRQTSWRIVWYFACARHECLLLDACPNCQQLISAVPGRPADRRSPWSCGTILPKAGHVCRHDLREVHTERLEPEHPVLRAQMQIAAFIEGARNDAEVNLFLTDLRAVAVGVLSLDDESRMAQIARLATTDLVGLGPQLLKSPTKAAPQDSLYMAATCTWALSLLEADTNNKASDGLADITAMARFKSRRADASMFEIASGEASERLRKALVLTAPDSISFVDRLRLYSASGASFHTQTSARVSVKRAGHVPQGMWPSWTLLLAGNRTGEPQSIRAALSAALLLPGTNKADISRLNTLLGLDDTFRLSTKFFANGQRSTGPILRAICQLADYLDEHGSPIDYRARRELSLENAVDRPDWETVARPRRRPRDRLQDYRFANTYLWQMMTGSLEHMAKGDVAIPPTLRPAYDSFHRSLTTSQYAVIHRSAKRFLVSQRLNEPVVWEPPLDLVDSNALPGRLCTSREAEAIRRDAKADRKYGGTAGDLGLSTLQVKLTLDILRAEEVDSAERGTRPDLVPHLARIHS